MTNFDRIRQMTEEEFADWLENFAEAYAAFWLLESTCKSVREDDKRIQLDMLRSEYIGDKIFEF